MNVNDAAETIAKVLKIEHVTRYAAKDSWGGVSHSFMIAWEQTKMQVYGPFRSSFAGYLSNIRLLNAPLILLCCFIVEGRLYIILSASSFKLKNEANADGRADQLKLHIPPPAAIDSSCTAPTRHRPLGANWMPQASVPVQESWLA